MSNEAQAVAGSPEAPGAGEYEAFLAVLSSSARGRAFLAEHARRARQADTETLLAALTRIEAMLAEQRAAAERPPAPPAPPPVAPAAPAATALAAVAAQAIAAAESDMPEVTVIKAGRMPPPARFAGEDFRSAESQADTADATGEPETSVSETVDQAAAVAADAAPPARTTPPGAQAADALAALLALSDDERLALFS